MYQKASKIRESAVGLLLLMLFFTYSSSAFGGTRDDHSRIAELTESGTQFGIFAENPGDDFTTTSFDDFVLVSWTPSISIRAGKFSFNGYAQSLDGRNEHHLSYRSNAP